MMPNGMYRPDKRIVAFVDRYVKEAPSKGVDAIMDRQALGVA